MMINLGQKLKQVGVVAGLVGCGLGMGGCQTIRKADSQYGTPIHKQEVIEGKEIKNKYLINSLKNISGRLNIQVSKQKIREDNITEYDLVPVTYKFFDVKKRPKGGMLFGGIFMYGVINAAGAGMGIVVDTIITLCGKPEETILNRYIMGSSREDFYYIDESSKKRISISTSEEKRNEKKLKKYIPIHSSYASNIPVRVYAENPVLSDRVNELTKNTDTEGRVIFQINGKSGKMKIETQAQDGENDRVELK